MYPRAYYRSSFTREEVDLVSPRFVSIMKPGNDLDSNIRHAKRRKVNPMWENAYVCPECGVVSQDIDLLIKLQRHIRDQLWSPDGPLGKRKIAQLHLDDVFKKFEGTIYELDDKNKEVIYEELKKTKAPPTNHDEAYQFVMQLMH